MKVQLLARPDHSLFLYAYLKKVVEVRMLTFNVAKKDSLLHKIHRSAKLVDDDVVVLYDLILFNQLIFRLGNLGLKNPYKWEGKFAELSYGMRADRFKSDILHYWPLYCHNYVRRKREIENMCTVADIYCAHPQFVLDTLQVEYDRYGLDVKSSYFYVDAERSTNFLAHENNIIANSEYVKDSFLKFSPGKKIYIADYGFLGDDTTLQTYGSALEFQHANPSRELRLVYVGTVSIEKGVHYLLDAVNKLNSEAIKLDLIGNIKPGQEKVFQPFFSSKGIKFLGPKPNQEIKRNLRTYSVLVLPSLSDANSIAIIEGLQNALPVIVTDKTGNKDAVEKFNIGAVVPAGDSEALRVAIEKFTDVHYRNSLSKNILDYIIEDSKYPYPMKVLDIYRTILEGKSI